MHHTPPPRKPTDQPKALYIPDGALTCLSDRPRALLAELSRMGFTRIPAVQPMEYARLQCGGAQAVILDASVADVDMSTIRIVIAEARGEA